MNHPPEPAPTACQSASAPDSKSSMTNTPSPCRAALLNFFGSSSPAVTNMVSAADTISAPATADTSLDPLGQRRDDAEAPDRLVGISLITLPHPALLVDRVRSLSGPFQKWGRFEERCGGRFRRSCGRP